MTWVLVAVNIAGFTVAIVLLHRVNEALKGIRHSASQLAADAYARRAHQRTIAMHKTSPLVQAEKDKGKAARRTDIPATGVQAQGLRFEMKGGDHGSNSANDRLPERGRRGPGLTRRVGGTPTDV